MKFLIKFPSPKIETKKILIKISVIPGGSGDQNSVWAIFDTFKNKKVQN